MRDLEIVGVNDRCPAVTRMRAGNGNVHFADLKQTLVGAACLTTNLEQFQHLVANRDIARVTKRSSVRHIDRPHIVAREYARQSGVRESVSRLLRRRAAPNHDR